MFNVSFKELVISFYIRGGGDRYCGFSFYRVYFGFMIYVDGIIRLYRAFVFVFGWFFLDIIYFMLYG